MLSLDEALTRQYFNPPEKNPPCDFESSNAVLEFGRSIGLATHFLSKSLWLTLLDTPTTCCCFFFFLCCTLGSPLHLSAVQCPYAGDDSRDEHLIQAAKAKPIKSHKARYRKCIQSTSQAKHHYLVNIGASKASSLLFLPKESISARASGRLCWRRTLWMWRGSCPKAPWPTRRTWKICPSIQRTVFFSRMFQGFLKVDLKVPVQRSLFKINQNKFVSLLKHHTLSLADCAFVFLRISSMTLQASQTRSKSVDSNGRGSHCSADPALSKTPQRAW